MSSEFDQRDLLSRRQIGAEMEYFLVPQSTETLRAAISKLQIKPMGHGLDPDSGRGRVSLYDPLLGWVLATYFHWPKLAGDSPEQVMNSCRFDARERRGDVDDALTERLAYYLFITDGRHGLDVRVLDAALRDYPHLLQLTLDGKETLREVLRIYKRSVISTSLQCDITHVPLGSEFPDDELTLTFGSEFNKAMERAGLYDPARDMLAQGTEAFNQMLKSQQADDGEQR